jgi:predicted nucleic acid-binding protein
MLFSARDWRDFTNQRQLRRIAYESVWMKQADFDRAIEVMGLLARKSQHRGLTVPDLLIAAVAERAGLIVLHYDSDFDRIASVTGQETEWVVPRGSLK